MTPEWMLCYFQECCCCHQERGMDSLSGGESIRALILLRMEHYSNGQHFYLIWPWTTGKKPLVAFDEVGNCYSAWAHTWKLCSKCQCWIAIGRSVFFLFLELLFHSDIWKNTVTHLVEGKETPIHSGTQGLQLEARAKSLKDVEYFVNTGRSYHCDLQKPHTYIFTCPFPILFSLSEKEWYNYCFHSAATPMVH